MFLCLKPCNLLGFNCTTTFLLSLFYRSVSGVNENPPPQWFEVTEVSKFFLELIPQLNEMAKYFADSIEWCFHHDIAPPAQESWVSADDGWLAKCDYFMHMSVRIVN